MIRKDYFDAVNGLQTRFHALENVVDDIDLSVLMSWYLTKVAGLKQL